MLYESAIVWSFDTSLHLSGSFVSRTEILDDMSYNIFDLIANKVLHYGKQVTNTFHFVPFKVFWAVQHVLH
jgi:hypothetical protein